VLLVLTHVERVRKTAAVVQTTTTDQPLIYRDLAPSIVRQRLVVEGTRAERIDAAEIRAYLKALSLVCDMTVLIEPVTHRSDRFGWAGWVHWETSGAHFYAWDEPRVFFSVDIYTCKAFDAHEAVEFTRTFLGADEVTAKEF
jgi:S-adenosylmethionine/arginine decarboxylase-like enzyme